MRPATRRIASDRRCCTGFPPARRHARLCDRGQRALAAERVQDLAAERVSAFHIAALHATALHTAALRTDGRVVPWRRHVLLL